MSKTKPTSDSHYELLYIISNKFTEDEAGEIVKKAKGIITANEGKVTLTESWGKKRLAYPIDHFSYGYYNLVEFDLAKVDLAKVDKAFKMSREILRHQIVKKKIKTVEQIKEEKEIAKKIAVKTVKEEKEAKAKAEAKDEKKLELKDLDEKLDKILDTDDLL